VETLFEQLKKIETKIFTLFRMEQIAQSLGMPSLSMKARMAVMRSETQSKTNEVQRLLPGKRPHFCYRNQVEVHLDGQILNKCLDLTSSFDEDDDTASTVSLTEEDFSFSNSISNDRSSVTFAEPVVTAIYTRCVTTSDEKHALYYCDRDFREFRRQYLHRKKTCLVQFPISSVVTCVHEYPYPETTETLYYTESDLKRFLDDFVSSLNEGFH
jgi:hypothetical protein